MVDLIYNGKSGREIAVALATRPSVPPPQKRGDWYDLGGVDGSMLSTDGTYENITIECQLNFVCPPEKVGNQYRRVKEWIRGSGELCFTDDPDVYYRVKAAQVAEFARRTKRGADMIAAFICDPYTYTKDGKLVVIELWQELLHRLGLGLGPHALHSEPVKLHDRGILLPTEHRAYQKLIHRVPHMGQGQHVDLVCVPFT